MRWIGQITYDEVAYFREDVIIEAGNKLGIGTTSPAYTLDVDGVINTNSNYRQGGVKILGRESSNTVLEAGGDNDIIFETNNAEKVRVLSNGNVGIGTTSPASKLHVEGAVQIGVNDAGHDFTLYGDTANYNMMWDASSSRLEFNDNTKAMFGNGVDLQIYHTGSHSNIKHDGTGDLIITQAADDQDIILQCDDGSGGTTAYLTLDGSTTHSYFSAGNVGIGTSSPGVSLDVAGNIKSSAGGAWATSSGGVQLNYASSTGYLTTYYDSNALVLGAGVSQKTGITINGQSHGDGNLISLKVGNAERMRITSAGNVGIGTTSPTQALHLPDDKKLALGTGADLQLHHDGSNSYIKNETGNLILQNNADDADIAFYSDDQSGSVAEYLRLDGSMGISRIFKALRANDDVKFQAGSGGDLDIFHSGTAATIENKTGNLTIKNSTDDGDIILQSDDGSGGVETYFFLDGSLSSGSPFTTFPDQSRANFGTGNDMQIYHDGTNTYMYNNGGDLKIMQAKADKDLILMCDDGSGGETAYLTLDGGLGYTTVQKRMKFDDNTQLQFGNGGDLQFYHTGGIGVLYNNTGDFRFRQNANDKDIVFQCDDGSGGVTAYLTLDGSRADGTYTYTTLPDSGVMAFGASVDMQLYHNATDSIIRNNTGDLKIINYANDKDIIFQSDDGSGGVETYFYLDGSMSSGNPRTIFPDNSVLGLGTGADLQLYHDGSNGVIQNLTGSLTIQSTTDDSDVILRSDDGSGGLAAYLTLDGSVGYTQAHKQIRFADSVEAQFGGIADLTISHDATNSIIANNTGDLQIKNRADNKDIIFECDDGSGGTTAYLTLDGSDVSTVINTVKVLMPNLPTSDPSVANQLWNDSGTLKISAG